MENSSYLYPQTNLVFTYTTDVMLLEQPQLYIKLWYMCFSLKVKLDTLSFDSVRASNLFTNNFQELYNDNILDKEHGVLYAYLHLENACQTNHTKLVWPLVSDACWLLA